MALVVAGGVVWIYEADIYGWSSWPEYPELWTSVWDDCGIGARALGGAAAGLLAGWQGGAVERSGARWLEDTSVRTPVFQRLMGLASGLLWPLAGYLLGLTVVLVWPQPVRSSGRTPFDALSVDAAFIVAVSCIAYLLGQVMPLRVTPLVLGMAAAIAGVAWQALFGIRLTYTGDPLPVQVASWAPPPPPVWLPWCRFVLVAALAVAAVLLSAGRWRSAAVLAVISVTGVLVPAMTQPGGYEASAVNSVEVRCQGHTPAICLSAPYEEFRPHLEHTAEQLSQRLRGVRGTPTHYVWTDAASCTDEGSAGASWALDVDDFDLESLVRETVSGGFCSGALFSGDCSGLYGTTPQDGAVGAWLLSCDHGVDRYRLADLPAPERTAWLSRYFAAKRRGASLPCLPFPSSLPRSC
ncbi:hypothetical protein ACIPSE_12380 [Streptomyces sp. NPDC090106]|uniref:hypothetical protein n=1 Tax=Streptomyces sp. NPDC090106 TaxID=3365946 RepID=UPI00381DEC46